MSCPVTLTWVAPPDPPGAPVLGYVVEYALQEAPGVWAEAAKVGDVETTTHAELEAGRGYRYRVAAYNKTMKDAKGMDMPDPNYMSPWSVPDSASTLPGDTPGPPDNNLITHGVSPAEAKTFLFWQPPSDPLGDPITNYIVQGRPTADDAETPETFDEIEAPWVTIKDNIDADTTGGSTSDSINSFEITLNDISNSGGRATYTDTDGDSHVRTYASLFKTRRSLVVPNRGQEPGRYRRLLAAEIQPATWQHATRQHR